MRVKDLLELLDHADPEATVVVSLGFYQGSVDAAHAFHLGGSVSRIGRPGTYYGVPVGGHANSTGDSIAFDDNGDFVILEAQAGHISEGADQ